MHGLQQRMVLLLLTAWLLQLFHMRLAEAQAHSTCGYRHVEVINATGSDIATVCQALDDVIAYFNQIGFSINPRFSLTFYDDVPDEIAKKGLHEYFDGKSASIVILRAPRKSPWGLESPHEYSTTFIYHELTHMAIRGILGDQHPRLRPEWHEFTAYAIQIELMDATLRDRILTNYSTIEPFYRLTGVNEFVYAMDPDAFAIASYKTFREKGGKEFIRQLLTFEFQPPRVEYPFLVFPDQVPKQ